MATQSLRKETVVARTNDPIRKIALAAGLIRYRFVVDCGRKPKVDKRTKQPILNEDGSAVMVRDQQTHTFNTLKEARAERARIISAHAKGRL